MTNTLTPAVRQLIEADLQREERLFRHGRDQVDVARGEGAVSQSIEANARVHAANIDGMRRVLGVTRGQHLLR